MRGLGGSIEPLFRNSKLIQEAAGKAKGRFLRLLGPICCTSFGLVKSLFILHIQWQIQGLERAHVHMQSHPHAHTVGAMKVAAAVFYGL